MSLKEHEKSLLIICFALFVAIIRSAKSVASFAMYSSKNIPKNITPTFTEVGGVT